MAPTKSTPCLKNIIALTLSAAPQEIGAALASGMDRHLGKSFKPHELARAIAETLGLSAGLDGITSVGFETPPMLPLEMNGSPFDLRFLRDFCLGDEAQVRHFIEKFEAQCPLEMKKLEAAFQKQDRKGIFHAAHSFKLQLEFVGLSEAGRLAEEMEQGAKGGRGLEELSALLGTLKNLISVTTQTRMNGPIEHQPFKTIRSRYR